MVVSRSVEADRIGVEVADGTEGERHQKRSVELFLLDGDVILNSGFSSSLPAKLGLFSIIAPCFGFLLRFELPTNCEGPGVFVFFSCHSGMPPKRWTPPRLKMRLAQKTLDFITRLAVLVPKPRVSLARFQWVFAPRSNSSEPAAGATAECPLRII
jgi:hypothetical protein